MRLCEEGLFWLNGGLERLEGGSLPGSLVTLSWGEATVEQGGADRLERNGEGTTACVHSGKGGVKSDFDKRAGP